MWKQQQQNLHVGRKLPTATASGNVAGMSLIPSTEDILHLENITKYNGFWL